jgi:hypothetical protein
MPITTRKHFSFSLSKASRVAEAGRNLKTTSKQLQDLDRALAAASRSLGCSLRPVDTVTSKQARWSRKRAVAVSGLVASVCLVAFVVSKIAAKS